MKHCNCDTEINRDGSGQLQRYLKALDPSYAPIDGRSTEDLLVFAKKYAAQIRFYDIPESKINDTTPKPKISWREFFRRDMAVIAASIAVTDTTGFKKEYDQVNERLQYITTPEVYAALYAPITGMIKKIDRWYTVAIPGNPLYNDLKLAIASDLKIQLQKIIAFEEGFKFVEPSVDLKIDLAGIENKEAWGLNETIPPDASIYIGTTTAEKILSASLFTEDIFHAFYNFLNKLIGDSEKYMAFAMEQYPAHQPHMALFITFLQLFNKAQQQMNGLTGRMLDFYYKEILHLETKPSVPDKAHIVFELAKDVTEYGVATGTALKAGPDASGIAQVYTTIGDLVINQAKVKELKTIFIEKTPQLDAITGELINTIYARPIANSADGFGEKFEGTDTKWPTFGIGSPDNSVPKNTCEKIDRLKAVAKRNDQTRIGFSIASPQLLLQGGNRLIELKLDASSAPLFAKQELMAAKNLFEIWFTGDKEWFKIDRVMTAAELVLFKKFLPIGLFNPLTNNIEPCYYLNKETNSLFVYLPLGAPPVISYDTKLHTAFTYGTVQPVMQVMLAPELDLQAADYKRLSVNNLILRVKVGSIFPDQEEHIKYIRDLIKNKEITAEEVRAINDFQEDGLTKLILQNDTGILPVGKPFDPFTAYPDKGKSFYIGSDEVFNKSLGRLSVNIKKTGDRANRKTGNGDEVGSTSIDYEVDILENRGWVGLSSFAGKDFSQQTLRRNILYTPVLLVKDNEPLATAFPHPRKPILPVTEWLPDTQKGFIRITNLITVNSDNYLQASQNLAHTLEIKEISVSYESELLPLEVLIDEFYHVYPFGSVETYLGSPMQVTGGIGINIIRRNTITKMRSFIGDTKFAKADEEKDWLLVNANNILLPQFTYLWPYDQYKPVTQNTAGIRFRTGNQKNTASTSGDELADKLILAASGLMDKISGGANQYSAALQEEGMLFIGIENIVPLQMVSMLFQFAEGSAADEDNDPPEIHWSYLTNNEWRPMKEEQLVSDGTVGFQTTGIVKIELPEDATNNNTIITSGLYWLCASVTANANRIPMLIDVVTQAVLAKFEDNNNDQSHFDKALPAGSISKLAVAVAEVGKVQQPFASFDGKHKEIGKEFYTRVSERLRHKARAITPWDYEHLVLDRFPSVYKVKCITHTDPNCLCREPEKKAIVTPPPPPPPPPPVPSCGIGKNDLKFNPQSTKLDIAESMTSLEAIIKKMQAGKDCKIIVTGFMVKDDVVSERINTARMELLTKQLEAGGIETKRYKSSIEKIAEEKDMINISEDVAEVKVEEVVVTAREKASCCGPQIAPGHVLLVPISNLKNRNAVNPLQPKTSRRVLLDIEAYIKKRTSPFVHVHAKNPVYEQVLVFFRVKFREGFDKGFYTKKLNDEIVHYLTPWAFDDIAEVKFGQKIYASSIINFIEERVYVDFITDFLMVVCRNGCCDEAVVTMRDGEDEENILDTISGCCDMEIILQDESDFAGDIIAKPSTARSLLVSAPKHIIIPYREPETVPPCEARKLNAVYGGGMMDKDKLNELIRNDGENSGINIKPVPLTGAVKAVEKHTGENITEVKKTPVIKTVKAATKAPKKK